VRSHVHQWSVASRYADDHQSATRTGYAGGWEPIGEGVPGCCQREKCFSTSRGPCITLPGRRKSGPASYVIRRSTNVKLSISATSGRYAITLKYRTPDFKENNRCIAWDRCEVDCCHAIDRDRAPSLFYNVPLFPAGLPSTASILAVSYRAQNRQTRDWQELLQIGL